MNAELHHSYRGLATPCALRTHTVRGNPSSVVTSKSLAASRSAVYNMLKWAIFVLLAVLLRKGDGAGIVFGFANGNRISKVVADGSGDSNRRQLIDDEESA